VFLGEGKMSKASLWWPAGQYPKTVGRYLG